MLNIIVGNNMGRQSMIIDENTTIRQALEQADIDYSRGMTSLDGVTLQPGQMDKTFVELGITEKCYLMNVVKADNAATIKVVGNVAVVESAATLETIAKLAKYRPAALSLFEGSGKDKEEVFRVGVAPKGNGSIGTYGVSFGTGTNADGKALVTFQLPDDIDDAVEYVTEKVGTAILKLNKVEEQFAAASTEISEELAAIKENIAVL